VQDVLGDCSYIRVPLAPRHLIARRAQQGLSPSPSACLPSTRTLLLIARELGLDECDVFTASPPAPGAPFPPCASDAVDGHEWVEEMDPDRKLLIAVDHVREVTCMCMRVFSDMCVCVSS
jgi:hypothetical protein